MRGFVKDKSEATRRGFSKLACGILGGNFSSKEIQQRFNNVDCVVERLNNGFAVYTLGKKNIANARRVNTKWLNELAKK